MTRLLLIMTLFIPGFTSVAANTGLLSFSIDAPREKKIELKKYNKGPILLINIATRCGYTGQLDDIEKLYKKYKSQGLTVIGIPSNDFGGQTPEEDQKVVEMCRVKYGASFPISTKTIVTGKEKHPLIKYILSTSGGDEIKWNFEKFLFDKNGAFISRFDSATLPLASKLEDSVKKAL